MAGSSSHSIIFREALPALIAAGTSAHSASDARTVLDLIVHQPTFFSRSFISWPEAWSEVLLLGHLPPPWRWPRWHSPWCYPRWEFLKKERTTLNYSQAGFWFNWILDRFLKLFLPLLEEKMVSIVTEFHSQVFRFVRNYSTTCSNWKNIKWTFPSSAIYFLFPGVYYPWMKIYNYMAHKNFTRKPCLSTACVPMQFVNNYVCWVNSGCVCACMHAWVYVCVHVSVCECAHTPTVHDPSDNTYFAETGWWRPACH